jgi:hypothetical protein
VSVILNKTMYMYMCPIPNGFRDRTVSLYIILDMAPDIEACSSVIGLALCYKPEGCGLASR